MDTTEMARELGKRGKDKPKTLSDQERKRRREVGIARLLNWHRKQGHKIVANGQ